MRKRDEWIERVKDVELEYLVARAAVGLLWDRLHTDPTALPRNLKRDDLARTADNLEATYFIRVYAVWEAGLREAWRLALGRDTQPPARDLLDGIGSARRVDGDVLEAAHRVREFRNALVHEQAEEPEGSVTIGDGRRRLTRFFSYLPPDW